MEKFLAFGGKLKVMQQEASTKPQVIA